MTPVPPMPSMASMAKHVDQRTRCQQQKRQVGQAQRKVGTVLGEQVERGNRQQKPESDAQLPRTRTRTVTCFWHGWIGFHLRISLGAPKRASGGSPISSLGRYCGGTHRATSEAFHGSSSYPFKVGHEVDLNQMDGWSWPEVKA